MIVFFINDVLTQPCAVNYNDNLDDTREDLEKQRVYQPKTTSLSLGETSAAFLNSNVP